MTMARSVLWMCTLGLAACAVSPGTPAQSQSLAGTRWIGASLKSTDNPATQPRLEFVAEGRVSGFTGCNMMSGTWRMEGGEARFGAIAATKRMCLGPEGEVEKAFLAVVNDRGRAVREGSKLVVLGPEGERFEFSEAK